MAGLSLRNIGKRYAGKVDAVKNASLEIEDKEFVILVGPSGCGKSTTLRMIAGLEEITSGELYIGDKLVNNVAPKDRDIAMVFQNYALYPHMTVFENMAFGLRLRKMPKEEINKRVHDAAKSLDIEHLLSRKPKALSGGQRQRVALGRAIVREPKVFLMDEPLSNLDAKLRVQMRATISKLHQKLKTTFVYVTHDQTEALTMGTKIVVMKDGVIQQVASPQELYEKPVNMFVAGFIGSPQMNFIDAVLRKQDNKFYFEFGKNKIAIPEGKTNKLDDSYIDKEVVVGIRPECVHDEEIYVNNIHNSILEARVEIVEMLGAETNLYLNIDGVEIIARVNPRTKVKPEDVIKVAFDMNKIHIFDKDTQVVLIN